uniref:Uncharacterized protein n=1 Tax=Graphocephala atropunctata TaxID=36148 RepID=A0A1B6MA18_9HEMI
MAARAGQEAVEVVDAGGLLQFAVPGRPEGALFLARVHAVRPLAALAPTPGTAANKMEKRLCVPQTHLLTSHDATLQDFNLGIQRPNVNLWIIILNNAKFCSVKSIKVELASLIY